MLALVFLLASFRFTRPTRRRKHKHKRMERFPFSGACRLLLAPLRRTCKPGRRKDKHKRKERKLKNSDKLLAYILETHALPFSAMLESTPKGSPAAFSLYASALSYATLCLCLCLPRTCKPDFSISVVYSWPVMILV